MQVAWPFACTTQKDLEAHLGHLSLQPGGEQLGAISSSSDTRSALLATLTFEVVRRWCEQPHTMGNVAAARGAQGSAVTMASIDALPSIRLVAALLQVHREAFGNPHIWPHLPCAGNGPPEFLGVGCVHDPAALSLIHYSSEAKHHGFAYEDVHAPGPCVSAGHRAEWRS